MSLASGHTNALKTYNLSGRCRRGVTDCFSEAHIVLAQITASIGLSLAYEAHYFASKTKTVKIIWSQNCSCFYVELSNNGTKFSR